MLFRSENGKIALQIVQEKQFNLVLMDIQMPVMDGISAAKKIRQLGGGFEILPIVAMTAHAMSGDREKSLEAGMNDHINKPIDPDKLYACLLEWIHQKNFNPIDHLNPAQKINKCLETDFSCLQDKMPNINLDIGLKRVVGNQTLSIKLLHEFADCYHDVIEQIKTALSQKDMETSLRIAHTVKGLSATIGAMSFHQSVKRLEIAIKENKENIDPFIDDSAVELKKVLSQISASLPKKTDKKAPGPDTLNDIDLRNELVPKLIELKDMVGKNDMASEEIFNSIQELLLVIMPEKTEQLSNDIDSFDFKKAGKTLDQIISSIEKRY